MTIKKFTFFSPNGTEFPVSANADAKLYMLLSEKDYSQFLLRHWETPINTALNRIYKNTSLLVGGRYFELYDEAVALNSNATNFVHANIDISNATNPVTMSVETSDNSNQVDINTGVGVLKKCIEVVTTNAMGVSAVTKPSGSSIIEKIYPVGAYYLSSQPTEPAKLFGFGTWSRVKGRGLVGVDESDPALSSGGKQGGSTNPLSQHTINPSSGQFVVARGAGKWHWSSGGAPSNSYAMDTENGGITVGDNTNHNNWQPFEAAYIWKRIN